MKLLITVACLCLAALLSSAGSAVAAASGPDVPPPLILVSFDGMRWDLPSRTDMPNLKFITDSGVHVKQVWNAFPTKTFPNHYTIATGLWVESHGIVGNSMYDAAETPQIFTMSTCGTWWNGGEPIWVTAEKQNVTSACFFWPGSNCAIRGIQPTHFEQYDESTPYEVRVNTVLGWVQNALDDGAPYMITLYFEKPDSAEHEFGPEAPEITDVMRTVDETIGLLLNGLETMQALDRVNLIITSDHGMTTVSEDRVVVLEDYVDVSKIAVLGSNPVLNIAPLEADKLTALYEALVHAHPNMSVFLKEDVPLRWHYNNSRHVLPLLLVADLGWSIVRLHSDVARLDRGEHGYDNAYPQMHQTFYARGPGFKRAYVQDEMHSVDMYPLMAHLLDLDPAPNNGSLENVREMLHHPSFPGDGDDDDDDDDDKKNPIFKHHSWLLIAIGSSSLLGLMCLVIVVVVVVKRRRRRQRISRFVRFTQEQAFGQVQEFEVHEGELSANHSLISGLGNSKQNGSNGGDGEYIL